MEDRIVSAEATEAEMANEQNLRPNTLEDYIGQESVKAT